MAKMIPEDFSGDMRTVLAKERTILAHQSVQLTKIGLSMGVFATGIATIKFFTEDAQAEWTVALLVMLLAIIVGVRAYVRYHGYAVDLTKVVEVEERMAREYRWSTIETHETKKEKN